MTLKLQKNPYLVWKNAYHPNNTNQTNNYYGSAGLKQKWWSADFHLGEGKFSFKYSECCKQASMGHCISMSAVYSAKCAVCTVQYEVLSVQCTL